MRNDGMDSRVLAGVLAGIGSALIGGGWQIATRHSTTAAGVAPTDLALLRYAIPALVLLPILWRALPRLRATDPLCLLFMALGGGLPFGLFAIGGTRFAPAAHMGVVVAGSAPLFAAVMTWWLWRERPTSGRLAGLALVAAGVALLGAGAWHGGLASWRGDLMFLAAAVLWAAFTLAFRRSGLGPWEGIAFVNAVSAAVLVPWWLMQASSTLGGIPVSQLAVLALWQGVLAGLIGLVLFAVAIDRLGAASATAFGALAPVFSATGAAWWLGEALSVAQWSAVALAAAGVALASGAMEARRRA